MMPLAALEILVLGTAKGRPWEIAEREDALSQADRLRYLVALGEAVEGMVAGSNLVCGWEGEWRYYEWEPAVPVNDPVGTGDTPLAALEAAKEAKS